MAHLARLALALFTLLLLGNTPDDGSYVYLPIVRSTQAIPQIGGAGVFHEQDCQGLGLAIGQNWITRRAYVPDCAVFIPNVSCTVRRYGDYRNGRLQLQEAAVNLPPNYSGYLLFLNEPLYTGQCNIDPYNAALLYWQTVEQYPNACISSPNFSHLAVLKYGDNIDQYIQAIADNAPDGVAFEGFCFWAVHNYHAPNPQLIYDLLTTKMGQWGDGDKPIWVTEYGVAQQGDTYNMMRATLCNPRIVTAWWYAPVGDYDTSLRDKNGLTPLGQSYLIVMSLYNRGLLCL